MLNLVWQQFCGIPSPIKYYQDHKFVRTLCNLKLKKLQDWVKVLQSTIHLQKSLNYTQKDNISRLFDTFQKNIILTSSSSCSRLVSVVSDSR